MKALLAALPLALGGGLLVHASTARMGPLRADLVELDEQGRQEGESFVRTLQGAHAERQLEILSRRRETALALAAARRNRLLGVILIVAAGLAFALVRAVQRVAAEVDQDRRMLDGQRSRPRGARLPSP